VSGFSGTVHLSVHWLLRWLSSTSRLPVFAIPLTGPQDSESRRSGFAEMAAPAEAAAVPLSSSSRACERRGAQPVKGTRGGLGRAFAERQHGPALLDRMCDVPRVARSDEN
jgi:hypothetical protein